jgi:putative FmdB family regulatory protein
MPIFEYVCDDCGNRFEKLVRRAAETNGLACPSCGQAHLTQQLSTFAARSGAGKATDLPACPGGMCRTPDFCGRN